MLAVIAVLIEFASLSVVTASSAILAVDTAPFNILASITEPFCSAVAVTEFALGVFIFTVDPMVTIKKSAPLAGAAERIISLLEIANPSLG